MKDPYEVICEDTREIERPEWIKLRKFGMGSSDAAPAMGMSPWTSTYAVWAEKSNLTPEIPDNERFLWGRLMEPLILGQAAKRGWITDSVDCGLMLRSLEFPWMMANPDGLTDDEVVEAKTADGWDEARWEIGVPDHYAIQGHHLMIVTGRRRCVFPVLFGGNNLRRFEVKYDPALAKLVTEATCALWERVLECDPPDADGSEATMLALRQVYSEVVEGKVCDLPEESEEWIVSRLFHAGRGKEATKAIDSIKARLMLLMGDAEVGKLYGEPVCTWRADKNGHRRFLFTDPKGT